MDKVQEGALIGITPTGTGLVAAYESQKMVKTYEFHLPMHNIREEVSITSPDVSTMGADRY